jgi:hypothetical protein
MARRNGAIRANQQAENRAGPKSLNWLGGLLCGALVTLARPTALLIAILFLPAFVAGMMDKQPGKPIARSVALFGLCGIVGPVGSLWAAGHTIEAAITLAIDLNNLAMAWGTAAVGWLLAELTPLAVKAVLEAMASSQTARLNLARTEFEEDWGIPAVTETD